MLIGRAHVLRRIDAALEAARSGSSRALVVLGEPGIGKSAVAQAAREAARGATNAEVAPRLFISEKTVERHLGAVYRKLGSAAAPSSPGASRARRAPPPRPPARTGRLRGIPHAQSPEAAIASARARSRPGGPRCRPT